MMMEISNTWHDYSFNGKIAKNCILVPVLILFLISISFQEGADKLRGIPLNQVDDN